MLTCWSQPRAAQYNNIDETIIIIVCLESIKTTDNTSEAGIIFGTAEKRAEGIEGNGDGLPKWWEKVGFGRMLDFVAVSGMIYLSFRDRFDILLEKRPSPGAPG